MSGEIVFKGINRAALSRTPSLLQELIPVEFTRVSEPGDNITTPGSLVVNVETACRAFQQSAEPLHPALPGAAS